MKKRLSELKIAGAKIFSKNFAGHERKNKAGVIVNREGERNFCLAIPEDMVETLQEEGWNVKFLEPKDPDDSPLAFIKVKIKYGDFPPKIYEIVGRKKTLLNADTVCNIDYAEIENIDLIINPYEYDSPVIGHGVTAYLKYMYVTIYEDEFASKYDFDDDYED